MFIGHHMPFMGANRFNPMCNMGPQSMMMGRGNCFMPPMCGDQFGFSSQSMMMQMMQMCMMMAMMQQLMQQQPSCAGGVPGMPWQMNQNQFGNVPFNPGAYAQPPYAMQQGGWQPGMPAFPGNMASRATQIAGTQVGVTGGNPQVLNYTCGRSEPWCADFASWVYGQAGNGQCPFGQQPGVAGIANWGQQRGLYHNTQYQPRPGDVVVFGNNDHTGIVEKVDPDGTVHTIEGNTSGYGQRGGTSCNAGAVARHSYNPGGGYISGYVDMQQFQ